MFEQWHMSAGGSHKALMVLQTLFQNLLHFIFLCKLEISVNSLEEKIKEIALRGKIYYLKMQGHVTQTHANCEPITSEYS